MINFDVFIHKDGSFSMLLFNDNITIPKFDVADQQNWAERVVRGKCNIKSTGGITVDGTAWGDIVVTDIYIKGVGRGELAELCGEVIRQHLEDDVDNDALQETFGHLIADLAI